MVAVAAGGREGGVTAGTECGLSQDARIGERGDHHRIRCGTAIHSGDSSDIGARLAHRDSALRRTSTPQVGGTAVGRKRSAVVVAEHRTTGNGSYRRRIQGKLFRGGDLTAEVVGDGYGVGGIRGNADSVAVRTVAPTILVA